MSKVPPKSNISSSPPPSRNIRPRTANLIDGLELSLDPETFGKSLISGSSPSYPLHPVTPAVAAPSALSLAASAMLPPHTVTYSPSQSFPWLIPVNRSSEAPALSSAAAFDYHNCMVYQQYEPPSASAPSMASQSFPWLIPVNRSSEAPALSSAAAFDYHNCMVYQQYEPPSASAPSMASQSFPWMIPANWPRAASSKPPARSSAAAFYPPAAPVYPQLQPPAAPVYPQLQPPAAPLTLWFSAILEPGSANVYSYIASVDRPTNVPLSVPLSPATERTIEKRPAFNSAYSWGGSSKCQIHSAVYILEHECRISLRMKCLVCKHKFDLKHNIKQLSQLKHIFSRDLKLICGQLSILRECEGCKNESFLIPIMTPNKRDINWLGLLFSREVGSLNLDQLIYYCKHRNLKWLGLFKWMIVWNCTIDMLQQLDGKSEF